MWNVQLGYTVWNHLLLICRKVPLGFIQSNKQNFYACMLRVQLSNGYNIRLKFGIIITISWYWDTFS